MKDRRTIKTDNATIYQTNENCQVFNGPISGCVFAMPGATVNHTAVQNMPDGSKDEKQTLDAVDDEPLRNHIFDSRLFDSNDKLVRLRNTIASAIDMGDDSIIDGNPQELRINPAVKSEWYYIMRAIKESGVAKTSMGDASFVDQMVEWFPMLFSDESVEMPMAYKRKLARSISAERSFWKQGNAKIEVTLKDMWAKHIEHRIGRAKANRVWEIAYQGLYTSLTNLRYEMGQETNKI